MTDQRTPADMQDYRQNLLDKMQTSLVKELSYSQESYVINQLLKLIADLTVALDDNPTDLIVVETVQEIARNNQDAE